MYYTKYNLFKQAIFYLEETNWWKWLWDQTAGQAPNSFETFDFSQDLENATES